MLGVPRLLPEAEGQPETLDDTTGLRLALAVPDTDCWPPEGKKKMLRRRSSSCRGCARILRESAGKMGKGKLLDAEEKGHG